MHGLQHGFGIVDDDVTVDGADIAHVEVRNNSSSTNRQNRAAVEARIQEELDNGHYVVVDNKPTFVSALSAVPKPGGDIRLVHDLSQPEGESVNDFATKQPFSHESVEDAINLIGPQWYMAKVDLKSAYRSVAIKPAHRQFTGLKWTFRGDASPTYMVDTRLPFGARHSPFVFNRITQAVKRIYQKLGHDLVVVYLDDFWIAAPSQCDCLHALNELIGLLRQLGFQINWNKVEGPTQRLTFLGIQIDTVAGHLSLNDTKTNALLLTLEEFLSRTRASRRQLERLAGRLSWASCVVPWGRLHVRRIFDLISTLKESGHKCRLFDIHQDLRWWKVFLNAGTNRRLIWDNRPVVQIVTDASSQAGGAFCQDGDWIFRDWQCDRPDIAEQHINLKELGIVCEAARHWCKHWCGSQVVVSTDNQATMGIINNGTSPCRQAAVLLRELSYLSIKYDFSITARYICGGDNVLADAISRLYLPNQVERFMYYLACWYGPSDVPLGYWLPNHMSHRAMLSLSSQITKWKTSLPS